MKRLGVTVPLPGFDVKAACDLARRAEDIGYTDAWSSEVSGPDAFSVASAVGVSTTSMRIGCAIAPSFTRSPALIAMSALAASQASRGRFCLGLGASTPTIVENWMGVPFEKPVTRTRETVEIVKRALAGDKVDFEGETARVKGFRLEGAPAEVPIFLAALGPKMMALANERADGIALYAVTEEGVRIARAAAPDLELVARLICIPDQPEEEVKAFARFLLTPYIAADGYNPWIARQGFEDEARAVKTAWDARERSAAVEAVSDRLVDALVISGPAAACKERLESLRDAGLDTPVLLLIAQQGPAAALQMVEAMAP
ncbi:MAG TPA: LLM class F420-dependent oxidoreductase [Actinomycetota bacterium]|nr:LLM class F420-dependent oxidoreductase [Actinomycetota bacterium]